MAEIKDRLGKVISDVSYILDNLTLLRKILQMGDCNVCANRDCGYMPKAGHMVRYNCPFYYGKAALMPSHTPPKESEDEG